MRARVQSYYFYLFLGASLTATGIHSVPNAFAQTNAEDDEPPPTSVQISLRALGTKPSEALVTFVAQNAQGIRFTPQTYPEMNEKTGEEIASALCGSVADGYLKVVANRMGPAENGPITGIEKNVLGAQAYAIEWPACLRVRTDVSYTAVKGDTFTDLRMRFTGRYADDADYFAGSDIAYTRAKSIPVGAKLRLAYVTSTTNLTLPAAAEMRFREEISRTWSNAVLISASNTSSGRIVSASTDEEMDVRGATCVDSSEKAYPFSPVEVINAYNAVDLLNGYQIDRQPVRVAVMDNGFFGVPCADGACPQKDATGGIVYASRFPERVFAPKSDYTSIFGYVGPRLRADGLGPINYENSALEVTAISGHGTAVAGQVLGGPEFFPYRDALIGTKDERSYVTLSIFALSNGGESLLPLAEDSIINHLSNLSTPPSIVNMSIAFDRQLAIRGKEKIMRDAIASRPNTLFVVAAGNEFQVAGGDGNLASMRYYPAAFGGTTAGNLMTVASIDADGRLSEFSNRGGDRVDLAAPGCRIPVWLNAERPPTRLTGTSQAAPHVTFAAMLLLSKWPRATPVTVKSRLIYSGDLIRDADSRAAVQSGTQLNIPKALFYMTDYAEFRDPNTGMVERYLGTMSKIKLLSCDGVTFKDLSLVRSVKRTGDSYYLYIGGGETIPRLCRGKLDQGANGAPNMITFKPIATIAGAAVIMLDKKDAIVRPASHLVEFVSMDARDL